MPKSVMAQCCALILLVSGIFHTAIAAGIEGQPVRLPNAGISAELYAAPGNARRPAVIILHGRQGIGAFHANYERSAQAIAQAGIDAYLLSYYANDDDARKAANPDGEERRVYFRGRIGAWSQLVNNAVGDILSSKYSSGRIGLLGFSQGGFVSVAAASQNPRISAITIFYGGVPAVIQDGISRLPPMLELHGDADRTVPLADGTALVDLARRLGNPAEQIVYPGAGHGFSGTNDTDARQRTIAFFQTHLFAP